MMDNQQITQLLLNQAQQKRLAPFYIVQNHPQLSATKVYEWMNQLLCALLESERRRGSNELTAHQDVDTWVLHSEDKQYKVEQVDAVIRQLQYSSFTKKRRYWVICNAHQCSNLIFNKLLKTLEEPPADTTIFLLNPLLSPIPPTVVGRALALRMRLPQGFVPCDPQGKSFKQFLEGDFAELAQLWNEKLSLTELAQKIHAGKAQDRFTRAALSWCQTRLTRYQQCQDFLQLVQFLGQQKTFHGRVQTQLALIIRQVQSL